MYIYACICTYYVYISIEIDECMCVFISTVCWVIPKCQQLRLSHTELRCPELSVGLPFWLVNLTVLGSFQQIYHILLLLWQVEITSSFFILPPKPPKERSILFRESLLPAALPLLCIL